MTLLFWILAGIMIAVAAAIVLRPLLAPAVPATDDKAALLAAGRERLAELDADLASGLIDPEQAAPARRELQRDLLAAAEGDAVIAEPARPSRLSAIFAGIALPVAALATYLLLGSPGLIEPPEPGEQLETAAAEIAAHLKDNPDDAQGWDLLARASMGLGRFDDAVHALERLAALSGETPDLLVRQADALARASGGQLTGRPSALLDRALALDPDNRAGLLLAGLAAAEEHDYRAAQDYWQRLLARMGNDEAAPRAEVERLIRRAQAAMEPADVPARRVTVRVSVAETLQANVEENAVVFVLARAPGGGMPLAVVRRSAGELPFEITLDDSLAMSPAARLSDHERVDVVARISRSGQAQPASGDLEGSAESVDTGAGTTVPISIDRVLP